MNDKSLYFLQLVWNGSVSQSSRVSTYCALLACKGCILWGSMDQNCHFMKMPPAIRAIMFYSSVTNLFILSACSFAA